MTSGMTSARYADENITTYSRNVGQMQRRRRCVDIIIVLGVRSLESMERRVTVVLRQSRILSHGYALLPFCDKIATCPTMSNEERSFSSCGPAVCNGMQPAARHNSLSLNTFKQKEKAHIFCDFGVVIQMPGNIYLNRIA